MTEPGFEIVVVGGGCIGSAILYELASRGHRGLGLVDQGRRTLSATARSGGMLRVCHENPEHVSLALGHWRLLERHHAEGVLSESLLPEGSLYFFSRHRARDYDESLKRMNEAGYPFEVLSNAEGSRRFPQFLWAAEDLAVYEPLGTRLSPIGFADELLVASANRGASILEDFEARRICFHNGAYRISGYEGSLSAKALILAGGARMLPRLRDLGLVLPLESRPLSAWRMRKADNRPALPHYFDRETLEFGCLGLGPDFYLSSSRPKRLLERPWSGVIGKEEAADCYSPGRVGLLGEVPGHPCLVLASGWGGTAFKFALEVGRRVGDLIERSKRKNRGGYAHL